VLAVGVEHHKEVAPRMPDAGFYGGSVSNVIRMAKDRGAGMMGAFGCRVLRPVIHHDDFMMVSGLVEDFPDPSDYRPDSLLLIPGGNYDTDLRIFR
jgi:hypothetical protein